MANKDLPSECHPDRKRFVGSKCTACYFSSKRALEKLEGSHTKFELRIINIIDNRLRTLGIYPDVIDGHGERAAEIWAEVNQKEAPKIETLPTGITIDLAQLRAPK